MPTTDLILLHAPSIYDFRKGNRMFGPISDVVPSSAIFEMYPIGFMIMQGYLREHGYSVRIINIALKMLRSRKYDAGKEIKSLKTAAFGIDLHWLPHAQGSLAIAEIVKKHHPETPVIFGGLSSSYFHTELMNYPQVDFVLRGDSVEEPLRMLLERIRHKKNFVDVPNLTWRDRGNMKVNPLTHSPQNLDYYPFDFKGIIKSTVKHFDIIGHLPFQNWLRYPIVAMLPWRGCVHNCIICGGSADFYRKQCGRKIPAYRNPDLIAADMARAARILKGPIILLGELRQAGEPFAFDLLNNIKRLGIKNQIAIELFYPASREYLKAIADAIPQFNFEISPESHDEDIRRTFGRNYDNTNLEQTIEDALSLGCKRFDLFFMIGLSKQTPQSVQETVDYCEYLIKKFACYGIGKVLPFISPLAPFLDPGSRAFEHPGKYGFIQHYTTLEQHRTALLNPSWKYMLSYETKWMSRDQIVTSTYKAALRLNRIKANCGIISRKTAEKQERLIRIAQQQVDEIEAIIRIDSTEKRTAQLEAFRNNREYLSAATLCKKDDLNWPSRKLHFNPLPILRALFK